MVAIGDLARVTRWEGLWAVTGQVPSASAWRRWNLTRWNGNDQAPTGIDRGEGDIEVLGHPTFTPGQHVLHWGQVVTVVEDLGDKVVVYIQRRREVARDPLYPNGVFINNSGNTPVDRGALVAENATRLLKLLETS